MNDQVNKPKTFEQKPVEQKKYNSMLCGIIGSLILGGLFLYLTTIVKKPILNLFGIPVMILGYYGGSSIFNKLQSRWKNG